MGDIDSPGLDRYLHAALQLSKYFASPIGETARLVGSSRSPYDLIARSLTLLAASLLLDIAITSVMYMWVGIDWSDYKFQVPEQMLQIAALMSFAVTLNTALRIVGVEATFARTAACYIVSFAVLLPVFGLLTYGDIPSIKHLVEYAHGHRSTNFFQAFGVLISDRPSVPAPIANIQFGFSTMATVFATGLLLRILQKVYRARLLELTLACGIGVGLVGAPILALFNFLGTMALYVYLQLPR